MAKGTGGWKASLADVLKAHNGAKAAGGSVASYATQDARRDTLYKAFEDLRAAGYRMETVRSFRETHMKALVNSWEKAGLSASTIQNRISVFRTFAGWIGKEGMIERSEKYVSAPAVAARSTISTVDKSWSGQGVDVAAKIAEVAQKDQRVALQLELQRVFGLRAKESALLRPGAADKGAYLQVTAGTKGGRDRVVPISTPEQRAVLDRAKDLAGRGSMIPSEKTYAQWKNYYYGVVRGAGITRQAGLTSHGLRHGYAEERYKNLTGQAAPVAGGGAVDRETDREARLEVASELGHGREDVTTYYLGR